MPIFLYRGRDNRGQLVSGRLEAVDKGIVADQLFGAGVVPIEIQPAIDDAVISLTALWRRSSDRVSRADLVLLFRQLHTLSRAGVPILRALAGLQESASSKALARVIDDMRVSLDSGRELSMAMRQHAQIFTPFHIAMVQVGESTGRIEEIFLRLSEHLDFEEDMRNRIKQAMRYPGFVVAAIVIAMIIANVFIIPQFSKMYESMGSNLPFLTTVLIGLSNFTIDYWYIGLGMAGAAWFAFKAWMQTDEGALVWDRVKLDLPVAGKIIRKATLARFSRSLALSIKSGVPLVQSLNSVAEVVDNRFIRLKVQQMCLGVQRGESVLATAAAARIFSPVVLQMIAIGDETGLLDELMQEVALMYEREVEYDVKGLAANIEPMLIVLLAGFVLILALGILSPMWSMHKAMLNRG